MLTIGIIILTVSITSFITHLIDRHFSKKEVLTHHNNTRELYELFELDRQKWEADKDKLLMAIDHELDKGAINENP